MKILYLILAGGDKSHLRDIVFTRNTWVKSIPARSSFFELYSSSFLDQAEIRNKEIWANCGSEYKDILRKTIISLQKLDSKLDEFDFIVRTNVSSYFDHSKIEKELQRYKHNEYLYAGYIQEYKAPDGKIIPYVSGAAIFWNSQTARLISRMCVDDYEDYPDDVAVSKLLKKKNVPMTFLSRGNICSHKIFTIASHYRVKSSVHYELAGIRMQNYHNFTLETRLLRKFIIFCKHQKIELSYFNRGEFFSFLSNSRQVLKIFVKYRLKN